VKSKSNQFCLDVISNLKIGYSRSTANLIMAMSSYTRAKHVVELSESCLYHYHYSGISKVSEHLSKRDDASSYGSVRQQVQGLCWDYYVARPRVYLQTDCTSAGKAHSPTLANRGYVSVPNNVIPGNKPLDVGYEVSYVNVSDQDTKWSLPMHIQRVSKDQTSSQTAHQQLADLLNHPDLGLSEKLVVNTADSKYGNGAFLAPAYQFANMVQVVRLRAGNKIWSAAKQSNPKGRPPIYGQKYYLIPRDDRKPYKKHPQMGLPYEVDRCSIFNEDHESLSWPAQFANGRAVMIHVWKWKNLLLETKNGYKMSDKPIDLVCMQVTDAETHQPIFKNEIYLAISGKRKDEMDIQEACHAYRHRYDIEPYFRFAKQHLFLEQYQTYDVHHFDNWLLCQQLATWLLYTAREDVTFKPKIWQQYLPENKKVVDKKNKPKLSIAQTRQAAQELFLTFDLNPFKPAESPKGRPRQKGEDQIKRKHYPVVKKIIKQDKVVFKQ